MLAPFIKKFCVGQTKPTRGPGLVPWARPQGAAREAPDHSPILSQGLRVGLRPGPGASCSGGLRRRFLSSGPLLHATGMSLPLPPSHSSWLWGEGELGGTEVSFPTWDTAVDVLARQILISLSRPPCPCNTRKEVTPSVLWISPQSPAFSSLLVALLHPLCSKLHASTGIPESLPHPTIFTTSLSDQFPDKETEAQGGKNVWPRALQQACRGVALKPRPRTLDHKSLTPSLPARTQPVPVARPLCFLLVYLTRIRSPGQVLDIQK